METIKNKIIEVRPHLSKQSVSTYTSILKNLYSLLHFLFLKKII